MRRSVGLGVLLAGVVAVAATGYLAGTRVQSAAEIAARKAPPPPSLITVPVERTVLSTEVITRGTVQFGAPREVTLPSSALKSGSRVVTAVPVVGTEVKEGDVAMAVSGRPVFMLEGAQPVYRDLAPGTSGEDVLQLETALSRLGFDPGPVDGLYDEATSTAVERWYIAAGWNAQGPTAEQIVTRRASDADVRQARLDVLDAEETARMAGASLDAVTAKLQLAELTVAAARTSDSTGASNRARERLVAEAEVSRLEGVLRVAVAEAQAAEGQFTEARDGTAAPATPSEVAILEAEVNAASSLVTLARAEADAARAAAHGANLAASTEVAARRRALDEALRGNPVDSSAIETARIELDEAEARADAVGSAGIADEAAKRRATDAATEQLTVARARLNDARTGTTRRASPADLAVKKAAVVAAKAAVTAATNDVNLARAALSALPASAPESSVAAATVELQAAQREVTWAAAALQIAERRAGLVARTPFGTAFVSELGFQVPADEVLFFPALPLRISALAVRVGDRVDGPVMTVTNSRLVVIGAVNAADAQVVQVRAPVRIDASELGVTANGTVAAVARSPGTQGVDAQRFYIEISPVDAPASLVGASVVLTINVRTTQGEVLAVPVSALSVGADGISRVQVQTAPGAVTPVTVRAGLAARGLVEVTPLSSGLEAGDLVVVGSRSTGKSTSK